MIYNEVGSGGNINGGISVNEIYSTNIATGGMIAGSTAINKAVFRSKGSKGAKTGGTSSISSIHYEKGHNGCVLGGTSIYRIITAKTTTGGSITGGISPQFREFLFYASGGSISGGISVQTALVHIRGTGGSKSSGSGRQTLFSKNRSYGGLRTFGHSQYSKTKSASTITVTGISECIQENSVIPPVVLPDIKANPRQEITGVWCPVEATCQGMLPKIIVVRQKGFVPPANGTLNPADRGIAIYAQSNGQETVSSQAIVTTSPHRKDPRSGHKKEFELVKKQKRKI